MQDDPCYHDVVAEIHEYLRLRRDRIEAAGIPRLRIALDPGIGFGKTHDATTMALFAGIAVTGGIAQLALTGALRLAPVALVMPMDYSGLIWAALLGLLMFGEWPAPATWVGAAVVILSGLVILWREHRLQRTRQQATALAE